MSDQPPRSYDWLVHGWLDTKLLPGQRTAFVKPDDVLRSPLAAISAIRALIADGHRVVIGRKKEEEGTKE